MKLCRLKGIPSSGSRTRSRRDTNLLASRTQLKYKDMGKTVYVRDKKVPGKPGWWPESKRIEVVTALIQLGNATQVSALTKVPLETIRTWKKSEWFKDMVEQIRDEDNQELDTKFSKIIRKTLDTIEDRLENGNFQFDPKTGRVMRIPVNLRDTHRVMSDLVDKRKVIRNEPTKAENEEGSASRLAKLAVQFAEMALKKTDQDMKQVGPIYEGDWEEDNAVHVGGEKGLQDGVSEVRGETKGEEGSRDAQQGTSNDDQSR